MNILFISSSNVIAANIALLLKKEGHSVRLFIDEKDRKMNFENMVDKSDEWKNDLTWVGEEGLIIFDDIGYGKIQDELRKDGFAVFGGCEIGDRLETDREFGQQILKEYGVDVLETLNFSNVDDCIEFVEKNKKAWVIKQNDHSAKNLNFVPFLEDGSDVLSVLKNYRENNRGKEISLTLQEKADGVEVGVGRFFNGNDWVGPIEINIEHKKMFPGDLGPATSEMGTVAWYDDNEENVIFQKTIAKLKPFLKQINFKGDFEVNCIVNEKGIFPLELTPRLGSPIIYLQSEIHKSPWGEFLAAIARGKKYDLKWEKGFGIVVLVAVPPFPYTHKLLEISPKNINIFFKNIPISEFEHIHFEGVAKRGDEYYISDEQGYVLYVTAIGKDIEYAQKKAYELIKKIYIPKMFYRNDIGLKFIKTDRELLKKWGYINI